MTCKSGRIIFNVKWIALVLQLHLCIYPQNHNIYAIFTIIMSLCHLIVYRGVLNTKSLRGIWWSETETSQWLCQSIAVLGGWAQSMFWKHSPTYSLLYLYPKQIWMIKYQQHKNVSRQSPKCMADGTALSTWPGLILVTH